MTFICLNIELRTQPLIILVVIAGTDKERPGCSKIPYESAILSAHIRIRTGEHTKSKQVCSHLFIVLTHAQKGL